MRCYYTELSYYMIILRPLSNWMVYCQSLSRLTVGFGRLPNFTRAVCPNNWADRCGLVCLLSSERYYSGQFSGDCSIRQLCGSVFRWPCHVSAPSIHFRSCLSTFSRLRVNWHKSTILSLGKDVCQAAFASTPLQKVSRVNYLWLTITNSDSEYFRLNAAPVISIFMQKLTIGDTPISNRNKITVELPIEHRFIPLDCYVLD